MTYVPPTPPQPYSVVQSAPQLPQDAALYPIDQNAEQQAAIHRHLGTLAVSNAMSGTHQPR